MRIKCKHLPNLIDFNTGSINTLIIENTVLFRNTINAFTDSNINDYFVFSKNFTPFEFEKHGLFIPNPLSPDLNNKKMYTKLNSQLEQIANDNYILQTQEIKTNLYNLGSQLSAKFDFDFSFNYEVETSSIIKLLDFKMTKENELPQELLVRYIINISKYLKINLFVIPNLHLYFTENELTEIFKTLTLNKIYLLLIECSVFNMIKNSENIYIIDSDLCTFDNTDIP